MFPPALEKLHVLVTGVDAAIARDVARLAAQQGASVIAADCDASKLARLDRGVGLSRSHLATAVVNLRDEIAVRRWSEALRASKRLPQVMICCCAAPTAEDGTRRHHAKSSARGDVSLSEQSVRNCPSEIARQVLHPSVFLHAEPLRQSVFDRALAVIRRPTLRSVLGGAPVGLQPIAGSHAPLRLISPTQTTPRHAQAA